MNADLILLAAGAGSRMGGVVADKILAELDGVPVFLRSWRACMATGRIERVVVVYRDETQRSALATLLEKESARVGINFVAGGSERADSVRSALACSGLGADLVVVHDAARPLIESRVIKEAIEVARRDGASVVARPVVDTIKRVAPGAEPVRVLLEDLDRSTLWAMETPQVFRRDWLVEGYARAEGIVTDDTAAVARLGHRVTIVSNPTPNPKITRPEDLAWAEFLLKSSRS